VNPEGSTYETWDVFRSLDWELMAGDHLVETLDELWWVLGVHGKSHDAKRQALLAFMHTPTWKPAPEDLKNEAAAFLRGE
jgi:hypothetical protein